MFNEEASLNILVHHKINLQHIFHYSLADKCLNLALWCAVVFIGYLTLEFSVELGSDLCHSSNFGQIKIFGQIHNDVILSPEKSRNFKVLQITCCYISFFHRFYAESDFDWFKGHKNKRKLYIVRDRNVIIH